MVESLLACLDEDKRAVFVLYELEGFSMKEVAEIVSCPLQTAYSRLHAARERLLIEARNAIRSRTRRRSSSRCLRALTTTCRRKPSLPGSQRERPRCSLRPWPSRH